MATIVSQAPPRTGIDPVTLEMVWSRLISIAEESETTLVRTSFSPIVGEASDHAAALLDGQGQILAQTPHAMPAFIGILGRTTRTMLEHYPAATLVPGDVLVTNDPWICCGHLNDVNVLRPVFHRGCLVAFAANTAHLTDIGGRMSAEAVDLFEEGLRILPTKLFKAGEPNQEVFRFLRANSRVPDQMIGDLQAQIAATDVAARRLSEMLDEYDLPDLIELSDEIQTRTERATREAIRALPDGAYHGEVWSDGFDEPLKISVDVVIDGDELTIDYAGTAGQVPYAINCPLNLTYAESVWAARVALAPDVPTAEGCLRPITVTAPEGCVLNPRFPAAVYSRTVVVHNVHAAIFQALAPLALDHLDPRRVQANSGCIWGFRFRGTYSPRWRPSWATQDTFVSSYLHNGGQGATGGADGQAAMSYPDNCANIPIEVVEARTPIRFLRKELRDGSGGAGQYFGGLGQTVEVEVLSDIPIEFTHGSGDKIINPPAGLAGGAPGGRGQVCLNGEPIAKPRRWITVQSGDRLLHATPGGGGYGDIRLRQAPREHGDSGEDPGR